MIALAYWKFESTSLQRRVARTFGFLSATPRERRQRATALLERRSLALPATAGCPADLYVGPRFNEPWAWAAKSAGLGIVSNRLIGDGARPGVGGSRWRWTIARYLGSSAEPFMS